MPRAALRSTLSTSTVPTANVRLTRRINQRVDLHAKKKAIEAEIDRLDAEILPELEKMGGKADNESWSVTRVDAVNRSINKEKLLSLGVKPTIILKATVETPYAYPRITLKKAVNDGGRADKS